MSSTERQIIRSPTTTRSDSYRGGATSRTTDRPYQQRSSITEDNEYEAALDDADESPRIQKPPQRSEDQYIAALRYRFPNRPKSDYSYSKPIGPSIAPPPPPPPAPPAPSTSTQPSTTAAQRNAPYQSTTRPTTGPTKLDISEDRTFPRPALRRVDPDQQNVYAKRTTGETPTPTSAVKRTPPGPSIRINEGDAGATRPTTTSTFPPQPGIPRTTQESVFEKVPSHGGPCSYLGTGTFSQFEHCLQECLERERRLTGMASQITRQDIPPNISSYDAYGYDHGLAPPPPPSSSLNVLPPTSSQNFIDYSSSRTVGMFTIDDIRQINVALCRSGISIFPYERPPFNYSYPSSIPSPNIYPSGRQSSTGEVVSACRVVEEDDSPMYNRSAVQNVPTSFIDASR